MYRHTITGSKKYYYRPQTYDFACSGGEIIFIQQHLQQVVSECALCAGHFPFLNTIILRVFIKSYCKKESCEMQ